MSQVQTQLLPVHLTDDEIRLRGVQLAALRDDVKAAEADFGVKREAHKRAVALLAQREVELVSQIRSRSERREVEIHENENWTDFTVETVRIDTGEVIETRGMTVAERQKVLPLTFTPRAVEKAAE